MQGGGCLGGNHNCDLAKEFTQQLWNAALKHKQVISSQWQTLGKYSVYTWSSVTSLCHYISKIILYSGTEKVNAETRPKKDKTIDEQYLASMPRHNEDGQHFHSRNICSWNLFSVLASPVFYMLLEEQRA